MIRVLFVIGSLDRGGAERQVVLLLQHLDRTRFTPVLSVVHGNGPLRSEVPADVLIELYGPPRFRHRRGLELIQPARLIRARRLARILEQQRIDVIYDRTYLATLDTAAACWFRPTPRVSAAVADPGVQFDLYHRRRAWFWRRFSRWAYHSASRVLTNSEGLRTRLRDYWELPDDKVHVVPNGIDFARIPSAPSARSAEQSGFRLLTVGRIDEHKGHADLLQAVDDLVHQDGVSDLRWVILGTGPTEAMFKAEVERRGLQAHVEFRGVVADPFPEYQAADLFVLPSLTEGSPNVLIEALACGMPVLSTDCDFGPREILKDGEFGRLVPVQSPSALREAIRACRANLPACQEQAQRGRQSVRERYEIGQVVRSWEAEISQALLQSHQTPESAARRSH